MVHDVRWQPLQRPTPAAPGGRVPAAGKGAAPQGADFQRTLQGELELRRLRLSQHARQRLAMDGGLDAARARQLEEAVDRAAARGARESLVLVDDTAYVVSVANRTVITVVDEARMREDIFTNIDSAVIVRSGGPSRPSAGSGHRPDLLSGGLLGPLNDGRGPQGRMGTGLSTKEMNQP